LAFFAFYANVQVKEIEMKKIDKKLNEAYGVYRFHELANAIGFSQRCVRSMMIILGDDEMFWVVTPAKGCKLIEQGYEEALW